MADLNSMIAQGAQFQAPVDPFVQYGRMQQLQQGQQANELNKMKMEELQSAAIERNALRQLNPRAANYEEQLFKLNPTMGIAYRKEATAAATGKAAAEEQQVKTAVARQGIISQAYRDISSRPSDAIITAHMEDVQASPFFTPEEKLKVQNLTTTLLSMPFDQRGTFLASQGSTAGDLKPVAIAPGGSLVGRDNKALFTAPPALTETNRLQAERATLIQSGVSPTDPRIQAYDQKLASGESQSAKLQRELQIAIANNAPTAHIAQLQRDIRNLHPGLAMQNVTGVDSEGKQIVTRFAGAGGGPQGQFGLNQAPVGTARAMLGLNESDSTLLFGPGGPVDLGQIPVNKLNASNAKMYVAAIKANPTLNLVNLTEDQILAASKARAQGRIQGTQVLTLVDRSTAQNIANGNLPPLTGPNSTKIMNEVVQINPNFKASDYGLQTTAVKAFNQGTQGNKVRSLNVVNEHFKTLEKAADALQSGDVLAINSVAQFIQTQTGKPAPGNFNAVKEILADEIVAAVVPGVGALADRQALKKTILAASSPEQLKGIVANYKELIGGQLMGLETQYKAGTGRTDFKSRYLTPAAVQGLMPPSANQYVETKTLPDGRTLGKKADGTVEEIK